MRWRRGNGRGHGDGRAARCMLHRKFVGVRFLLVSHAVIFSTEAMTAKRALKVAIAGMNHFMPFQVLAGGEPLRALATLKTFFPAGARPVTMVVQMTSSFIIGIIAMTPSQPRGDNLSMIHLHLHLHPVLAFHMLY